MLFILKQFQTILPLDTPDVAQVVTLLYSDWLHHLISSRLIASYQVWRIKTLKRVVVILQKVTIFLGKRSGKIF